MRKVLKKVLVARAVSAFILLPGFVGSTLAEASDSNVMCTNAISDLGIVIGWVTNLATPGDKGEDRWVRNDNLSPLGRYRGPGGHDENFYEQLFGQREGQAADHGWGHHNSWGSWGNYSDWYQKEDGSWCSEWCSGSGPGGKGRKGHGGKGRKHGGQRGHGQGFPVTTREHYLDTATAAKRIDERYEAIFAYENGTFCEYQLSGANFHFRNANMTCTLVRNSKDILQLECSYGG